MTTSYRDLVVWQRGMVLVTEIYKLTQQFPKEELYGLISQLRRAAVSIVSNIAEGYNRQYRGEYAQFLSIAYGSCAELATQLTVAQRLGYGEAEGHTSCNTLLEETSKMLYSMIKKVKPER